LLQAASPPPTPSGPVAGRDHPSPRAAGPAPGPSLPSPARIRSGAAEPAAPGRLLSPRRARLRAGPGPHHHPRPPARPAGWLAGTLHRRRSPAQGRAQVSLDARHAPGGAALQPRPGAGVPLCRRLRGADRCLAGRSGGRGPVRQDPVQPAAPAARRGLGRGCRHHPAGRGGQRGGAPDRSGARGVGQPTSACPPAGWGRPGGPTPWRAVGADRPGSAAPEHRLVGAEASDPAAGGGRGGSLCPGAPADRAHDDGPGCPRTG
jgi:hypothetical protein